MQAPIEIAAIQVRAQNRKRHQHCRTRDGVFHCSSCRLADPYYTTHRISYGKVGARPTDRVTAHTGATPRYGHGAASWPSPYAPQPARMLSPSGPSFPASLGSSPRIGSSSQDRLQSSHPCVSALWKEQLSAVKPTTDAAH